MAITLNSFSAGQVIVAADVNTNFDNINSWSDTVALKAGAAFTGNVTITSGTFTIGANTAGDDVKFFGDASGAYMEWDATSSRLDVYGRTGEWAMYVGEGNVYIEDTLDVDGTLETDALSINGTAVTSTAAELNLLDGITAGTVSASLAVIADSNKDVTGFRNVTLTGELDAATLDISGNADIDGITNLDAVDIDGAVQIDNTITVGVDDTGYDVKFFGASAGHYMLWDQASDALVLTSDSGIYFFDKGNERIQAAGDGHLNIDAGTTLDLTAPTIDLNASTEVNIDGNVDLNGNLDFTGTLNTTSANSIPRMAYNAGGAATVATHQMNAIPTIFINPVANAPTATAAGDIWFGV
tara:strand:- start:6415 stop:7479 length:1065 start_codon:yes stop_codon:yes gene_type:complete